MIRNSSSEQVQYLYQCMQLFKEKTGYPYTLHDAVCITYLLDPDTARLKKGDYTVELHGDKTRGTMVDLSSYYEIETDMTEGQNSEKNKSESGKFFYHAVSIDHDKTMQIMLQRIYGITAE